MNARDLLGNLDSFAERHLGPTPAVVDEMLTAVSAASLDALAAETIPENIRLSDALSLEPALTESEALQRLRGIADKNQVWRSFIGMGYYGCHTPAVIQRNILENPGWYTQYTPYQAEIAQGRLEALLNFQTMVSDLTGLPMANASLLDEATAAAEAMAMCFAAGRHRRPAFFVEESVHPQTMAVLRTRAEPIGVTLHVGSVDRAVELASEVCGALLSYPTTDGRVEDYSQLCQSLHDQGASVVVATDLLALALLTPPGEFGADIAIGSSQRFGVPMGYGGPHAAFLAASDSFKRQLPGRLVGVSKDRAGRVAYRLALQTREQHIRRDRATSNICTAQVLLAIMASMYAVYHGPERLIRIATRVRAFARLLRRGIGEMGYRVTEGPIFDTFKIFCEGDERARILSAAGNHKINLRLYDDGLGISVDETTTEGDAEDLLAVFAKGGSPAPGLAALVTGAGEDYAAPFARQSSFLEHESFHQYHSEHDMLRYLHRLEAKDLSLTTSMIPLGSCTMKLNATSEMLPVTWKEFSAMHPFAPGEQAAGYHELARELEAQLAEITGFSAVSLQPNAGAQGEYAGLLTIRAYHADRGQGERDVCLIPVSAHGTNPASAVMAGYRVVAVKCDERGNIDVADLRERAGEHREKLAAIMITYPSTHGVFEESIREICDVVHEFGGQVYLDGANMNAQVGLCRPGDYGADVCHLNLHKTFCIPHGGGGPGMGPIAVAAQLAPYLPGHPMAASHAERAIGPISAAPYGSPSILPISWMYIAMMGPKGLTRASQIAILNANYMVARLKSHFDVLYTGDNGRVAHEFILDTRPFKKSVGVEVDDLAKRLMDYGFHAPTMSFPVPGTLMIEPTESESREELDRLCDALIAIRGEIRELEEGRYSVEESPLRMAPHTAEDTVAAEWKRPYSRHQAVYPAPWLGVHKYWPAVSRIDNAFGDRNLICTCVSVEDVAQ